MAPSDHDCRDLEQIFDGLFGGRHRVRLRGGHAEPLYVPEVGGRPAEIRYRADYFASALHEVAHWSLAGAARRRLPDYGYWYAPDGRDLCAQARFEAVEVAPQALEWLFAEAAGYPFRVSIDNLDAGSVTLLRFQSALNAERERRLRFGLPPRARDFRDALCHHYGTRHG